MMDPPTSLMVVMLLLCWCVLPSHTLHTQEESWRHRRHGHQEHRYTELGHHHHDHHHYTHYLTPRSYLPDLSDNSIYGGLVKKELVGVTSQYQRAKGSRWAPGEGLGATGSSWTLTYPSTPHKPRAFDNTVLNVTAQLGGVAFLPCCVSYLGERQVSWIRRRDWRVLTSAEVLYTLDRRFSVLHVAGSPDWTLHIKSVDVRDAGMYECHVSTGTGVISLFVSLSVVTPEAHIPGHGYYHVNRGSPITLTCAIHQSPTPPRHVLWRHNGQLLNYAHDRPEVKISMKVRDRAVSRLEVSRASDHHSGNYTCSAHNTRPTTTRVFITEGDKTAAVQRLDSGCQSLGERALKRLLLPLALALLVPVR